ncbi:hypothetical protein CEP45_03955 [Mergibacter septicus]|uniref:hypothetical protein n=1 Tax=Mergibacter septicus TaxID=221402 RepID=UPI001C73F890|nr:hypothetical protein [Mergibacter septicus]QDJ13055.1 hypothetical protein CEP45_03955 [Mergibacter septicus]
MRINQALLQKQLSKWQQNYFDWYALYGEFSDRDIKEVIWHKLLTAFNYCVLLDKVIHQPEIFLKQFCYFKGVADVSRTK